MKRYISCLFIFILTSLTFIGYADTTTNLDRIVVLVNKGVITQSQLDSQIKIAKEQMTAAHTPIPEPSILRKKVLEQLIDAEIQLQIAKKNNITVTDKMLDDAIKRIADQNNVTVDDLKSKIAAQGLNYVDYRKEIQKEMTLSLVQQKVIAPQIRISDQEVMDYINNPAKPLASAENKNDEMQYHIQTIVIPVSDANNTDQLNTAKNIAQQALSDLRQGKSFDQIVSSQIGIQYNIQQSDLGWRKLSQLPDLYLPAIKNLRAGNTAGPIQAPNGFHIIKLTAIKNDAGNVPAHGVYEMHVRHILIKTAPTQTDTTPVKRRLEELRASILGGMDFAQAAINNSQDPGSAGKGGDLGWITAGAFDPAFEEVMKKSPVGYVSQPFKTAFGWHILQVLGRREINDSLAIRKQQAKQAIFERKYSEQLKTWLATMRKIEFIKILD